ncbi:AF1514 family protein [Thermodesulfobacteriota bacterium]
MTENPICPISSPDLSHVEVVCLSPESTISDFQQALALAKTEAEQRLEENMLMSWFDRDRDFESPPHTSECSDSSTKDGYINYGLSHGATLKVDIEAGRFVFFFAPVKWY